MSKLALIQIRILYRLFIRIKFFSGRIRLFLEGADPGQIQPDPQPCLQCQIEIPCSLYSSCSIAKENINDKECPYLPTLQVQSKFSFFFVLKTFYLYAAAEGRDMEWTYKCSESFQEGEFTFLFISMDSPFVHCTDLKGTLQSVIQRDQKFLFFSGGCEDMPILQAFFTNFSLETIYLSPDLREKWLYLQN